MWSPVHVPTSVATMRVNTVVQRIVAGKKKRFFEAVR